MAKEPAVLTLKIIDEREARTRQTLALESIAESLSKLAAQSATMVEKLEDIAQQIAEIELKVDA